MTKTKKLITIVATFATTAFLFGASATTASAIFSIPS